MYRLCSFHDLNLFFCLEFCPWKRWRRGNHHAAELRQNRRGGEACVCSFVVFMCVCVCTCSRREGWWTAAAAQSVVVSYHIILQRILHLRTPLVHLWKWPRWKDRSIILPERPGTDCMLTQRGGTRRWIWCPSHLMDSSRKAAVGGWVSGWMDGWMNGWRWGVYAQVYRRNRWALSLSAMGVHKPAQSALRRIQDTDTYAQRTQVDCLLDFLPRHFRRTHFTVRKQAHLILWTLALAKSFRLNRM